MQNGTDLLIEANSTVAIIVAGGRGSRLVSTNAAGDTWTDLPKQYILLGDTCILQRTIDVFTSHKLIDHVLVVIHPDDREVYDKLIKPHNKLLKPVTGGTSRQESVLCGLHALANFNHSGKVLIHDAARPFADSETIDDVVENTKPGFGAIPAAVVVDTLKEADEHHTVSKTVPRSNLYGAQTPQGFMFSDIYEIHQKSSKNSDTNFTDDASMFEAENLPVKLLPSPSSNFKITTNEDLLRARMMVNSSTTDQTIHADIRTGNGYDVHAFEPGDAVILCGLEIPFHKKLKGHSDADVALHALTDALLGTIGAGDIGTYFPPTDPKWKNAQSDIFLKAALDMVAKQGGCINNIDITIICEAPRIGPHRLHMKNKLAAICDVDENRVSVKATTNEKLGFLGREEGIAAIATASVSYGVRT